jgi:hypothetical protein
MNEYDCVEVIIEKEKYIREGVHKGMQGWICFEQRTPGYWLVNFPQYGDKDDIATISIKEVDLKLLPNGMDAKVNERIKAQHEVSGNHSKLLTDKPDDLSGYLI